MKRLWRHLIILFDSRSETNRTVGEPLTWVLNTRITDWPSADESDYLFRDQLRILLHININIYS